MKPTRVNIPDALKAGLPPTTFGKILGATPVVMAVVSTMLAGLASSEMTRAQYDRSLGAQQQSKAGDQWSYFQAKRVRAAIQANTADLLGSLADVRQFDPEFFTQQLKDLPAQSSNASEDVKQQMATLLASAAGQQTLRLLAKRELPPHDTKATTLDPGIKAAIDGVENSIPDAEMKSLLAKVDDRSLEDALKSARDQVQAFDTATKPVNLVIDQLDALLTRQDALRASLPDDANHVSPTASLNRHFTAARLHYAALRYEWEARLNQVIANLYELQVRKSNITAEKHHKRSQEFFFGMLAAQAGVIISTFAMAARNRNLLWALAAGAGLLAIVFAVYVYLFV